MSGARGLRAFAQRLQRDLDRAPTLRVGFLDGATYPDGTSVASVAAFNEYGDPARGRPPRPFMRQTIEREREGWGKTLAAGLRMNDYNAAAGLGVLGEDIAGAIRETISQFDSPPLALSTIARKGFAKPLVDTGMMLRSVSWELDDGA